MLSPSTFRRLGWGSLLGAVIQGWVWGVSSMNSERAAERI